MRTTIQVLQPGKRAVNTSTFLLIILLICFTAKANEVFPISSKEQTLVYQAAFSYLVAGRPPSQKIQIQKQTSLTVIKKFNFKNPSYYILDTANFILNDQWKKFLNNVDTSHFKNSGIQVEKIISTTLSSSMEKPNAMITLSPAIISYNNALAVCAYQYIDNLGNNVQGVLLLEKTSTFWGCVPKCMMDEFWLRKQINHNGLFQFL